VLQRIVITTTIIATIIPRKKSFENQDGEGRVLYIAGKLDVKRYQYVCVSLILTTAIFCTIQKKLSECNECDFI
jgi:hypothetical protein